MDAEDLRAPDMSFDVVLCELGLMYVPDPLKALQEMYRVLRAGGRAVAVVWGQRNRCGTEVSARATRSSHFSSVPNRAFASCRSGVSNPSVNQG